MTATAKPDLPADNSDDPSMEDILASIRRILSEEEAQASDVSQPAGPVANEDVLVLDSSMMVPDPHENNTQQGPEPPPPPPATSLVAPAAAAAAASSMGALVRTLAADRAMQVHSGGPTIEDIVRGEIRPLLKEWLDTNLPSLVERLVRAEIERVVGRAVP
jgi:cell pole-organizing protein PopZ